jgi:hypothetical protein
VSRYIYISEEYYRLEEVATKKKQLICTKHSRVYNTIDFLGWNHGSNKAKKKKKKLAGTSQQRGAVRYVHGLFRKIFVKCKLIDTLFL